MSTLLMSDAAGEREAAKRPRAAEKHTSFEAAGFLAAFPQGRVVAVPESVRAVAPLRLGGTGAPREVWVLSANKGMGKSKAVRASLPPRATVLNVTFRRSLARNAAADLPRNSVYLDYPEEERFTPERYPVLTVLINSLLRVGGTYAVLVLDEWVSILEMLAGELIPAPQRFALCHALLRLVRGARFVIVADALLDAPSLHILALLVSLSGAPAALAPAAALAPPRFALAPLPTAVTMVDYRHRNHADHTYLDYGGDVAAWTAALVAAVAAHRRRVVVPCMTKSFALRISETLARHVDPARILTYVAGDPTQDLLDHMRRIDEVWAAADVLVYSPVITAGCSFEVRGHYDECFLYGYQGTASVRSAIQMTFRVRDLARKTLHVVVAAPHAAPPLPPLPPPLPPLPLPQPPPASSALVVHDAICAAHEHQERHRMRAFAPAFWQLVRQTGVRVRAAPSARPAPSPPAPSPPAPSPPAPSPPAPTRDWQARDLMLRGVVSWAAQSRWARREIMPGSARRDAVAQAFDRSAAEFDPLLWHAALLEALCAPGAAAAKHASEMARLADRLLDHHGGAEVVRLLLTEWARREDGGAAGGSGGARGEKALLWDPLRAALQGSLPPAAMPHGLRLAAFLPAAAPHRPLAVAIFVHPFHYLPRAHVMRAAAVNAAFGLALLAALGGAGTHAPSTPLPCRFCLVTVDGGCGFERQGMLDVGAALRAIRFDRLAPVPLPAYPADPHVTPASLRRHLEQQCALILARRDQDHQGQQRTHAPAPPRIRALRAVRDPRCTAEMRGLMRDEAERGLMRDEAERGLMRDEAERGLMRVMASGEHVIAFLEGESEPLVLSAVPLAEDDQEHEEQEQEARELLLEVEEEEDRRVREAEERMLSELFPVVDVVDGEEGG